MKVAEKIFQEIFEKPLDKLPGLWYIIITKGKEIKKMTSDYWELNEMAWEDMHDWMTYEADLAAGDPWAE